MRRRIIGLLLALCMLASASAETVIRLHDPESGETLTRTVALTEGFSEDSPAVRLQELQIISQRDPRFAGRDYRYIDKQSFEKNGCGPAALHNGLAVTLGIEDPEESGQILLELMRMLAVKHDPVQNRINYDNTLRLIDADAAAYPALARLMENCAHRAAVTKVTADRIMKTVNAEGDDLFLVGRITLSEKMEEIVKLADALCEAGHEDAVIAVAAVSAGMSDSRTPFGLGDNGHYITWMILAGEFRENGTIYVLDSFPRAIRGEKLNDLYSTRYYFAANDILTQFRVNYNVTRVSPTVLMCTLREDAAAELAALKEAAGTKKGAAAYLKARVKYAGIVKTYGTGTLMVRVFPADMP